MATTTDTLTETPTTTEAAAAKSARTFRQSGLLSESTLRKLRTRHQEFGHAVAVKLGALLRLDCQVDIAALQTVSFEAFLGRLLTPTHLVLFKLESLRGICILETPPQFALPIVNRLLGGSSKSVEKDNSRVLNEIETALLDQIADILLGEWCHVWHDVQPFRHSLLGHEIDGRLLHTAARDSMMIDVVLEFTIGESKQNCRIGLPYLGFEPLLQKMNAVQTSPAIETAPQDAKVLPWNTRLDDAPIRIRLQCSGLSFTTRELAGLKVGDSLPLDPQRLAQVQLCLGDKPKFVGSLGKVGNRWAMRVTHKQEPKTL